ncbi:MAG: hypothetical protein ACFB12_06950 [Leptolyngbyaceae cyanobacterium]
MNQRVFYRQRAIAISQTWAKFCLVLLASFIIFPTAAIANEAVATFNTTNVLAPATNFPNTPYANPCNDDAADLPDCDVPGAVTNLTFGAGNNLQLDSIVVAGSVFAPARTILPATNGLADRVVFRRSPVVPFNRNQLFFEYDTGSLVTGTNGTLNINPQEATSLEDALLGLVINRGIDNIFNNDTGGDEETRNNIERVDYIIDAGITIPAASSDDFGFLIMDRGGNDSFKIAAITALDGAGNPAAYGPLQTHNIAWAGASAANISTAVARQDDILNNTPPIFRPSHLVNPPQDIRGRFFSLVSLFPGPAADRTVFGYSLFPNEAAITDANAVNFNSFPTNTNGTTAGGLDLIAGGAAFTREPPAPSIGLAKNNSLPRTTGTPGVFDFDIILRVTNTGNVALTDVQITENLQDALITSAANQADSFVIQGVPTVDATGVTGTAPTINAGYNGVGDTALFAAGNSFNPNDTAVVTVTVRVTLGTVIGGPPPLNDGILIAQNQASAAGDPATGGPPVTDLSQDGDQVDPDGDGNPGNNSDPTPLQIPFPSIGVAKSVSPLRPVANTTEFEFDFTIVVTNTGSTILDNVALQENLQDALITNATNRVDSFVLVGAPTLDATGVTGTAPTISTTYDAVNDIQVFDAGVPNSFNPGDTATVVITVRADLGSGGAGPLNDGTVLAENTATATGTPSGPGVVPGTPVVSDASQSGTAADPDNNGDPADNNQPTQIQFSPSTGLVLVKRITNVFRQGIPVDITGINAFNDQPNDLNNNDVALNAALGGGNQLAGLFTLPNNVFLQPDDEVEYSLFFWNNSGGIVQQLNLCDELQPPSVLNVNAGLQLSPVGALGAPTFAAGGTAVQGRSPGAPLDNSCISAPGSFPLGPPGPTGGLGVGAGGGVVAGTFDVPPNQFGAIRFRVRLP